MLEAAVAKFVGLRLATKISVAVTALLPAATGAGAAGALPDAMQETPAELVSAISLLMIPRPDEAAAPADAGAPDDANIATDGDPEANDGGQAVSDTARTTDAERCERGYEVAEVAGGDGSEEGSASGSASGSGSASASGTGSGSGSASGSAVPAAEQECSPVGEDLESQATATVDLALSDYAFEPSAVAVEAGIITFATTNVGTETHELAFLPDGGDVPFTEGGEPDEEALAEAGAFELEAYGPGQDCNATYELEPGTYTLFCIVEAPDGEAHYEKGMRGTLEVR